MAVQMKTSMRSDFMISDAAMPRRMAELDKEQELQMAQFAKILGDIGNESTASSGDTASDVQGAISDLEDNEKFERALDALDSELRSRISAKDSGESDDGVYRSKSTGEELPADTYELAKKVAKGELSLTDIPDDLITDELIKKILMLMLELKLHGKLDDEDDASSDEELDPAVAAVNERDRIRELDGAILSELYKIVEKQNKKENQKAQFFGEAGTQNNEAVLPSIATEEAHAEQNAQDGVFEQIIDNIASEAGSSVQVDEVVNIDAAVPQTTGENAVIGAGAVNGTDAVNGAETMTGTEALNGSDALTDADALIGAAQLKSDNAMAQTADLVKAEEFSDVIESFTAKEAPVSEAGSYAETTNAQKSANVDANRVKNASEELEMLKSAKLIKTQTDLKPTETANPLMSDSPIVFTRPDGTEIEVKPTEIVNQTMRIIEKAIEETKDQSEYSLVLNPEEVGRITVKLIKAADGAITVTIAAENAHTQRVLEQHSELMQNNLRNSGINLESWQTVNESRQETYAQDYNGSSKNPYFRRDDAQNDSDNNEGDRTFADIIAAM